MEVLSRASMRAMRGTMKGAIAAWMAAARGVWSSGKLGLGGCGLSFLGPRFSVTFGLKLRKA
jgi:hypothetical protein